MNLADKFLDDIECRARGLWVDIRQALIIDAVLTIIVTAIVTALVTWLVTRKRK